MVYVRNDVIYLKYASEEPTPAATITESDVLTNTLKLSLSSTDEVATKQVVSWSRSQEEGELKLILKHNVAKYGTHGKEISYYTQNVFDNILKSATFWMIRDANVWKIAEFSAPIKHLALEVFDCVTLDLSDLSPVPVKAIVTSMKYDAASEQIDVRYWLSGREKSSTLTLEHGSPQVWRPCLRDQDFGVLPVGIAKRAAVVQANESEVWTL